MRVEVQFKDLNLELDVIEDVNEIKETLREYGFHDNMRVKYLLNGEEISEDDANESIGDAEQMSVIISEAEVSNDIVVEKSIGNRGTTTVIYREGMTVNECLNEAMAQLGYADENLDELSVIDVSTSEFTSFPKATRNEQIRPGARLVIIAKEKQAGG